MDGNQQFCVNLNIILNTEKSQVTFKIDFVKVIKAIYVNPSFETL